MTVQRERIRVHAGGLSDDDKFGPEASASIVRQVDLRRSPGRYSLTRALTKESGSTIITQVDDMVRVDTGSIYMAGITEIYKRTPGANGAAGTYSVDTSDAAIIGVRDLDYRPDLNKLFAIDAKVIHELYDVTGTPTWDYDKYREYVVLNQNNGTTSNAYTLLTSLTEGAVDIVEFVCSGEPLYSVTFNVDAKGASGDWVLTIHDGADRVIATKTIAFASVPAAGNDIEFIFDDPVRLKYGSEYHIHLHVTAGTHSVHTATASDLSTADVSTKAYRLVDTGEHGHFPIQFGPFSFILNERYVAKWEHLDTSDNATSGFNPHEVFLPAECVGIGATIYNESIAIACGKANGSDSQNDELTDGIIFFYNGAGDTYQYALEVPQGVPYGLRAHGNILYFECDGQLYRWAGGDIEEVFEFPGVDDFVPSDDGPSTEVYLRAARRSICQLGNTIKIGWPYATANTNAKIGLYSWGKSKSFMPLAMGQDNIISTGHDEVQFNTATTPDTPVTGITCIKQFGNNILVAWKDVVSSSVVYGVDYINDTSVFNTSGRYVGRVFDAGVPELKKTSLEILATAVQLPEGCTITPIIEYDRSGTFFNEDGSIAQMTEGETMTKLGLHKKFRECRFGVDIASSSGNRPEGIAIILKYDDNQSDGEADESEDLDAS